jgi:nitroreductase
MHLSPDMSQNLKELVTSNRSYRRFHGDHKIEKEDLADLVELARLSASGANRQPLKFLLSYEKKTNDIIFPKLGWAGYLTDWDGPIEEERPSAYIVILGDTTISTNYFVDHGIMAQSMLLGASEKGLGGCMLLSIKKDELRSDLKIPDHLEIVLVVALGKPKEKVVLEDVVDDDIRYYRDDNGVHHVPKRSLQDLIFDL